MPALVQKKHIKHLHEDKGMSLNKIAQETKLDYRAVMKYAQKDGWNTEKERKLSEPIYPAMGPYIEIVEGWLEKDKLGPRKQRHTAKRAYGRLREEHGYAGSEPSVGKFVREAKELPKAAPEGSIPLARPPAQAQIGFGDSKRLGALGQPKEGHALVVSFPYSNAA